MQPNQQNCSDWLHEELIQISQHYNEQYEYRLQYERENEYEYQRDHRDWNYSHNTINYRQIHQRRMTIKTRTEHITDLEKFICEEENFQRLKLERQQMIQRIFECINPASPKFIAYFRIRETNNNNKICSIMAENNIKCMICLEEFQLNDSYSKWLCPSKTPHIFHYHCMLNTLRMNNTCPICRYPVQAGQLQNDIYS